MDNIRCEECKKRLGDKFLISADKVAKLVYWEGKEDKLVIARGTKIVLTKGGSMINYYEENADG